MIRIIVGILISIVGIAIILHDQYLAFSGQGEYSLLYLYWFILNRTGHSQNSVYIAALLWYAPVLFGALLIWLGEFQRSLRSLLPKRR